MRRVLQYILGLTAVISACAVAACAGNSALPGIPNQTAPNGPGQGLFQATTPHAGPFTRVCTDDISGYAHCDALRRTDIGEIGPDVGGSRIVTLGHVEPLKHHSPPPSPTPRPSPTPTPSQPPTPTPPPTATPTPTPVPTPTPPPGTCTNPSSGYTPCDLQSAYKWSTTGGAGQTVAIVDAFDDPNAEADLGVYRAQFGLPACTTGNGCFRKVDQNGGTSYPSPNAGWAQEISLDLDMVSAVCPNCHILLVEGNSNSFADLAAAANYAGTHANSNSHSYGGGESASTVSAFAADYAHPATTASSGDSGFTSPQFPADLATVTAVGGTSLTPGGGARGWSESAWGGAGSGCSSVVATPAFQNGITTGCSRRAYADVSAVADPNTGVDVYDTYQASGWLVFGGTSVASPIIASVYALAGNASTINDASFTYAHTGSLFDVTSGSNGRCGAPLCVAGVGWDGPTGNGSPNGTGAF